MLSKEEVEHISKLARLGISKEEKKKFQKELSSILDYMEKLKKADVSNIKPTSHSVLAENEVRTDEPKGKNEELAKRLADAANDKKEGFIRVKAVF
ncbi:MAG: Asp-tRNA(Asn)/Glu-tRNA(Gln) amidotransferase subunit GatC [Candidatus Parcubacteria bacterium]|nr:Asp-tRNA(Asn)/Glu-tRNA(Gln) amidotransferase subunit GatC [Candidatus Parcubacteria bacterium]